MVSFIQEHFDSVSKVWGILIIGSFGSVFYFWGKIIDEDEDLKLKQ